MSDDTSICCATKGREGNDVLHVLAKRAYRVLPTGQCRLAPTQLPLVYEPVDYEQKGQGGASPLKTESDAMCNGKPGTDVVIQGRAHTRRGPQPTADVAVAVTTSTSTASDAWRYARRVRVFGDRRVEQSRDGQLRFSAPLPFETMDLTYDRAYGGRDLWAEKKHPDPLTEFMKKHADPGKRPDSAYAYPRNPAGRGYLVKMDPEALAELNLPNVEDPANLLTPERLCVGDFRRWHQAVQPAGFDWVDPSWFPRLGFLGLIPDFDGGAEDLPEVRQGYLPAEIVRSADEHLLPPALFAETSDRFCHGGSPGFCLPTLIGTERILVSGMHPGVPVLEVPLPGERPRVVVEPPIGARVEPTPALRTVVLDVEGSQLVTVWEARVPMDRPLTETQKGRIRYSVAWS
jgi:hypothetical protein